MVYAFAYVLIGCIALCLMFMEAWAWKEAALITGMAIALIILWPIAVGLSTYELLKKRQPKRNAA